MSQTTATGTRVVGNAGRAAAESPDPSRANGTGDAAPFPTEAVVPTDDTIPYTSLKAFLAENASLIFMVGSLTSLSTFMVNLDLGWLDTYLKGILLAAAVVVWFEFHSQWPDQLRLDRPGHVRPARSMWRLEVFSLLMQLLPVLFATWAVVQSPEVAVPILAVAAAYAGWHRLCRGRARHRFLLVAMVLAAFLASEFALGAIFPNEPTMLDLLEIDLLRERQMLAPGR